MHRYTMILFFFAGIPFGAVNAANKGEDLAQFQQIYRLFPKISSISQLQNSYNASLMRIWKHFGLSQRPEDKIKEEALNEEYDRYLKSLEKGEELVSIIAKNDPNSLEQAQALIEQGASLDIKDKDHGTSLPQPLWWAIYKNRIDIVKLLFANGLKLNNDNETAETFYLAAEKGNDELAELLINNGANVNATTWKTYAWDGITQESDDAPLHSAAYYNRVKMAKLLIQHHATVNKMIGGKPSAILIRSVGRSGEDTAMTQLLLENGADVNATNFNGSTALHEAARLCRDNQAALLIQHHIDPFIRNNNNKTALDIAREQFNQPMIDLINEYIKTQNK